MRLIDARYVVVGGGCWSSNYALARFLQNVGGERWQPQRIEDSLARRRKNVKDLCSWKTRVGEWSECIGLSHDEGPRADHRSSGTRHDFLA